MSQDCACRRDVLLGPHSQAPNLEKSGIEARRGGAEEGEAPHLQTRTLTTGWLEQPSQLEEVRFVPLWKTF